MVTRSPPRSASRRLRARAVASRAGSVRRRGVAASCVASDVRAAPPRLQRHAPRRPVRRLRRRRAAPGIDLLGRRPRVCGRRRWLGRGHRHGDARRVAVLRLQLHVRRRPARLRVAGGSPDLPHRPTVPDDWAGLLFPRRQPVVSAARRRPRAAARDPRVRRERRRLRPRDERRARAWRCAGRRWRRRCRRARRRRWRRSRRRRSRRRRRRTR